MTDDSGLNSSSSKPNSSGVVSKPVQIGVHNGTGRVFGNNNPVSSAQMPISYRTNEEPKQNNSSDRQTLLAKSKENCEHSQVIISTSFYLHYFIEYCTIFFKDFNFFY